MTHQGETKSTFKNKIIALNNSLSYESDEHLVKAIRIVVNAYSVMNEDLENMDKWFLLILDLFEWRWKEKIQKMFEWWELDYNGDGHYRIEPEEYICPKKRWEMAETSLRQPTYHSMYNVPDIGSGKLTYWDVFGLDPDVDHSELVDYFSGRRCPEDLKDILYMWAEDESVLNKNYRRWVYDGLVDHIYCVCDEKWKEEKERKEMEREENERIEEANEYYVGGWEALQEDQMNQEVDEYDVYRMRELNN